MFSDHHNHVNNNDFINALNKRKQMETGELWASDIFEGRIWLGAGRDAANLEKLEEHGITHILNCADDVDNFFESERRFQYKQLFVSDFGGDKGITRVFPEAFEFIDFALGKHDFEQAPTSNNGVLIHCANGSNRSATVAIAVLMHRCAWNLLKSWTWVCEKRPQIAPLRDNRMELLSFEFTMYGVNSVHEKNAKLIAIEET